MLRYDNQNKTVRAIEGFLLTKGKTLFIVELILLLGFMIIGAGLNGLSWASPIFFALTVPALLLIIHLWPED